MCTNYELFPGQKTRPDLEPCATMGSVNKPINKVIHVSSKVTARATVVKGLLPDHAAVKKRRTWN